MNFKMNIVIPLGCCCVFALAAFVWSFTCVFHHVATKPSSTYGSVVAEITLLELFDYFKVQNPIKLKKQSLVSSIILVGTNMKNKTAS